MIDEKNGVDKAYASAMRLINFKMRTKAEIIARLEADGISGEVIRQALPELERCGYIDDRKYAEMYIEERSNLRGYGVYKIKHELRQKGVPGDIISDALDEADIDQLDAAKKLLEVRLRYKDDMDEDEMKAEKRRCYGYLQRRGYPTDVIMKALNEFFRKAL